MRLRMLFGAVSLVGVTALVTSEVVSQDTGAPRDEPRASARAEPQPQADEKPTTRPDTETLVDTWVRHAMPGEHHKLLERMAGNWNLAVKYRMDAEAPVVESQGTCQRKWILGNLFLLEEFDGGSLALPFQGLAIYGYDSFEQKYTSAWVDTMNTAITTSLGSCREACERIDFVGRHGDPWTGTKRPTRGMTRFVNDDQHVLELYEPDSKGREFKILEIVYTREQATG